MNDRAKIVLVTAFPSFENAVSALESGIYDYVSKPVELDELAITVERALRAADLEQIEQFRGFFVAALKWRGCDVLTASGGEQALAMMDEHGADVVFCDVFMPGMNGLQTIERIADRRDPPKIVLMSGAHNREATLEGASFRYAHIRTLDKPFYLDALLDLLAELIGDAPVGDETT